MKAVRLPWFVATMLSTVLSTGLSMVAVPAQTAERTGWWENDVAAALKRAGDNGGELRNALRTAPRDHREEVAFLIAHMPSRDLRQLTAAFLLENVALAKTAVARAPWGKSIPRSVFLNDVLPYVNVSERRDSWRKEFHARFHPLVEKCKTPGEAAQVLNSKVFALLKVRYSTARRRADQSPSESAALGKASCTGLSIILADACRSVGVPARLVGIPNWVGKRGNHTWVEVWDDGWKFTGAAEPSARGLNHAWFVRDAAKARADDPRHAIYAVSYKKTIVRFPMVWSRRADPVSAVNVTGRYVKAPESAGTVRLMVRVRAVTGGPRIVADVEIWSVRNSGSVRRGRSRGERNDTNDILTFDVDPKQVYVIRAGRAGRFRQVEHRPDGTNPEILEVTLPAAKKTVIK
jgi:Transglutaminase-like superfamily